MSILKLLMRIPLWVQAAGVVLWLTSQAQPLPPAQEVAAALQKKYDSIHDFTADFVHESEGGLLRKKQTERGVVQVKKPGKMRWDYKSPEPKVFVSDGRRIYLHVPADNQVIISQVPEQDQATTAVLFLVGKGNLTRDFTVTLRRRRRTRYVRPSAPAQAPRARLRLAAAHRRSSDASDTHAERR